MKKLIFLLFLLLPMTASAQLNTHQGGTGLIDVSSGSIPFGSTFNLRLGTSSALQWNNVAARLSFTYGSSTAFSTGTLCLTGDVCRTTWPTGSAGSDPFTHVSYLGQTTSATSTLLQLTGAPFSLAASSTALFSSASTTLITATSMWFTSLTSGALAVDSNGKVYKGATSTLSTISGSLDLNSQVGVSRLPFANLAQISANSVLGNNTGATADGGSVSTSSLYVGTNGQTLARVGGAWVGTATTTAGTGLSYDGTSFNCVTGTASVFGCLPAADFTTFSAKQAPGFQISTTSGLAISQLTYITKAGGVTTLGGTATSAITATGVLSLSNPASIIGGSATALTVTGGSNGQVMGWLSGVPTWTASSSLAAGTGISVAAAGAVTTVSYSGAQYPWTAFTTFGTTTAATSSSIYTAGAFFASSTVAASQFPFASTTALSGTTFCLTGDTCRTTWPTAGAAFPFSPETWWGQASNATGTAIHLTGSPFSLFASSTVQMQNASTTLLQTIGSTLWLTGYTSGELAVDANHKVYLGATTTAGTGLTYNSGANTFTVNSSQSIGTLSNLGTNGFVRTSGSNGTLGVQTDPCTIAEGCTASTTMYDTGILFYNGTLGTVSQGTAAADFNYAVAAKRLTMTYGSSTAQSFSQSLVGTRATFTGALSPIRSFVLGTATTTSWTASTTGSVYSPFLIMPFAGTVQQVRCATDASFVAVNTVVNGSNATPSYFVASTTIGIEKYTSGNTFTAGQKIQTNFGTTTTAGTASIQCTFDVTETP